MYCVHPPNVALSDRKRCMARSMTATPGTLAVWPGMRDYSVPLRMWHVGPMACLKFFMECPDHWNRTWSNNFGIPRLRRVRGPAHGGSVLTVSLRPDLPPEPDLDPLQWDISDIPEHRCGLRCNVDWLWSCCPIGCIPLITKNRESNRFVRSFMTL